MLRNDVAPDVLPNIVSHHDVFVAWAQVEVGSEPNPWDVANGGTNVVAFVLTLDGQAPEDFDLAISDCGSGGDYSFSASTDLDAPSVTFQNEVVVTSTTFCAKAILNFNGEEAATFDYEMTVNANSRGEQEMEADTPETTILVNSNQDSQIGTINVEREAPPMDMEVVNEGPIAYGENVFVQVTSPSPGYQFECKSAQSMGASTVLHGLTIVSGGPEVSPLICELGDFQIEDFSGQSIALTIVVEWSVLGAGRRTRGGGLLPGDHGQTSYVLQVNLQAPQNSIAYVGAASAAVSEFRFVSLSCLTVAVGLLL